MSVNHEHPNRKRLVVFGLVAIFLVLILVAVLNRMTSSSDSLKGELTREQWPVSIRTVKPEPFVKRIKANGILQAMEETAMAPEVSAKVASIEADLGDRVKKGQVLIRLDASAYKLGLNSAQAQYAQAKAALELAADQYDRTKKLADKNLISDEALDQASTNFEASKAQKRVAQANLSIAKRNLKETGIRAPFDGRISARNASPGELASPGVPIISVVKDQVLKIDLALSEMEIKEVKNGMAAVITLPSMPGKEFAGTVTRVGVAADRSSGSFPVRVVIDNSDFELLSGMRAKIDIELKRYLEAVIVTRDNIVEFNNQDAVYVAEEKEDKTVARTQLVELGERDGERVRVVSGLNPGDQLIIVGQQSIKGGARLLIIEKDGRRVAGEKEDPENNSEANAEAGADA